MRQWKTGLLLAALSFAFTVPAFAGPGKKDRAQQRAERAAQQRIKLALRAVQNADRQELAKARSYRKVKLSGEQVTERVAKLQKLDWQADLDAAYATAKKTGKPILWIHALGTIDGFL